jgi:phosphatidylglycerophosphatase C
MAQPVVVFDLDGTLTKRDTSAPFLLFVAGGWSTGLGLLSVGAWAIPDVYKALTAERRRSHERVGSVRGRWEGLLHERIVGHTLRGRPRSEIEAAAEEFARATLTNALRADAKTRLDAHAQQGHRLVLASASLAICLEPLLDILGFDTVLGTRLEFRDGVATGKFQGLPCWGDEKLRRVREVMDPGEQIFHAYGDSRGDHALLRAAQHSTLVR